MHVNTQFNMKFSRHKGSERKILGYYEVARLLLIIVLVMNADIFFWFVFFSQRTPDLEQTKRRFQFRLFFYLFFSISDFVLHRE